MEKNSPQTKLLTKQTPKNDAENNILAEVPPINTPKKSNTAAVGKKKKKSIKSKAEAISMQYWGAW